MYVELLEINKEEKIEKWGKKYDLAIDNKNTNGQSTWKDAEQHS